MSRFSLSIRRVWGKRGRRKAKKGGSERRGTPDTDAFTGALSLLPSPFPLLTSPLLSPSPLGRPDTQASPDLTTLQPIDRPL